MLVEAPNLESEVTELFETAVRPASKLETPDKVVLGTFACDGGRAVDVGNEPTTVVLVVVVFTPAGIFCAAGGEDAAAVGGVLVSAER